MASVVSTRGSPAPELLKIENYVRKTLTFPKGKKVIYTALAVCPRLPWHSTSQ